MSKRTKFAFIRPYLKLLYKEGRLSKVAYDAIIFILDDEEEKEI